MISVRELVTVCDDPYRAAEDSYAIVICTEWDEFTVSFFVVMVKLVLYVVKYSNSLFSHKSF